MKLSSEEKTVEKIVLLLLDLDPPSGDLDHYFSSIANEATGMAYRATQAKDEDDPSWWEVVGRPAYNARLARIKGKLEKREPKWLPKKKKRRP